MSNSRQSTNPWSSSATFTYELAGLEVDNLLAFLADLIAGRPDRLAPPGIAEVYRARRIANGKFTNVSRAMPVRSVPPTPGSRRRSG